MCLYSNSIYSSALKGFLRKCVKAVKDSQKVLCTVMGDTSPNFFIGTPNIETLHSTLVHK